MHFENILFILPGCAFEQSYGSDRFDSILIFQDLAVVFQISLLIRSGWILFIL